MGQRFILVSRKNTIRRVLFSVGSGEAWHRVVLQHRSSSAVRYTIYASVRSRSRRMRYHFRRNSICAPHARRFCVLRRSFRSRLIGTQKKFWNTLSLLNNDPTRAHQMASESTTKLQQFRLEHLVVQACEFAQSVKQQSHNARRRAIALLQSKVSDGSDLRLLVDVIVRAGDRSINTLARALRCVTQQDFGRYRVLLVDYKGRDDIATS